MQFSLEMVREVARLLKDADLAEISLESAVESTQPQRLTVRRVPKATPRPAPRAMQTAPSNAQTESPAPATEATDGQAVPPAVLPVAEPVTLRATAVGLFRETTPPSQIGATVRAGQVLGSVESMKIPTDIVTPVAGRIIEVLVEEGRGVEYNQPLIVLETA